MLISLPKHYPHAATFSVLARVSVRSLQLLLNNKYYYININYYNNNNINCNE